MDLNRMYEGDGKDKSFERLSTLKNKKLNKKKEFVEKYKNMVGHDSITLIEWMASSDRSDENINYFDLRASILSALNEIFEQ